MRAAFATNNSIVTKTGAGGYRLSITYSASGTCKNAIAKNHLAMPNHLKLAFLPVTV